MMGLRDGEPLDEGTRLTTKHVIFFVLVTQDGGRHTTSPTIGILRYKGPLNSALLLPGEWGWKRGEGSVGWET